MMRIETSVDAGLMSRAKSILTASVPADLVDDRYDGSVSDLMVITEQGADASLSCWWRDRTLHCTAELSADAGGDTLNQMLDALQQRLGGLDAVELWGRPERPAFWEAAQTHGFAPRRHLLQLAVDLSLPFEPLPTRSFDPDVDGPELVRVNNAAFASHPDQGGWTLDTLAEQAAADWFDPNGIRLYEEDGTVVGFCWTKIHRQREIGEIYIIGLDPSVHGRRLGAPMTAAGLAWMAEAGLKRAILFVEAENHPAVRTYTKLGFTELASDRSWGPSD